LAIHSSSVGSSALQEFRHFHFLAKAGIGRLRVIENLVFLACDRSGRRCAGTGGQQAKTQTKAGDSQGFLKKTHELSFF
jgi:hypothetical protein